MRKVFYWLGWVVLIGAPLAFAVEILAKQDLPPVAPWQWATMGGRAAARLLRQEPRRGAEAPPV
jgi:hypothetical protein